MKSIFLLCSSLLLSACGGTLICEWQTPEELKEEIIFEIKKGELNGQASEDD